MSHKIEYLESEHVIKITFGESLRPTEAIEALSDLSEFSKSLPVTKFVLDQSITEFPDVNSADIYNVHASMGKYFPLKSRVAAVMNPQNVAEKDLYFAEMVTTNRGLQFKFFYSLDDAFSWLSGES